MRGLADLKADIGTLKTDLKADIAALKDELKPDLDNAQGRIRTLEKRVSWIFGVGTGIVGIIALAIGLLRVAIHLGYGIDITSPSP
ncbi:MAG: hypothetical protein OXN16_08285 [Gammaproteobacteria bacterium]|nr:hypothetical protein [Gammaproteobacteria bacterium]